MNSRIKEDVHKLFEFWCEITKTEDKRKLTGIIIESFPESFRDEQIIAKIPDFAYPCEFENKSIQTYSFVLTSDDSKWRFGFCRHDHKTQTAMVIITYLPWHDTFLRFLTVLGELRRTKNGEFESFLSEAYNKGVPEPGASLKLFYNAAQNHFIFQRPSQFQLPSIPENHNLNLYYNFVDPKNMIAVFAAMLAERRIIFTSKRLDKLSSCIQAANSFLYPMVWQHIFIPVLPMKMKDILSAPMPYLIGAPEAVYNSMTPEELGEVVVLNCDSKEFKNPFDDVQQMPPELVSQMKKHLNNPHDHIGDRVSRIFLGVLVQLIGGYRDAVRFSQDKKITWNREAFVESRPPHLRPFLSRMMELQIFQQFIDERLEMLNTGLGFSDEFELETLRYAEKMGKRGKNYKEFLRNVKDKTNPAVKSAVKSVKEGSRGVKTAYKDLKSKLRDITPPKSQFHSHISSTGNHDGIGNHHHRSAPNSPVFAKRQIGSESFGNAVIRKQSVMSTSNSQVLNGFTSYANFNNNNHHSKSPTISPSSSLCSSDMNISQELQNHPLFKSPTVDRSLKPSNSLDYTGYRAARFGAPVTAPIQRPTATPTPDVPVGSLCIIDDDDKTSIFTNDSLFDSPPDMPSPPVPPKRTNGSLNRGNLQKATRLTSATPPQLPAASMSASFAFENNFVSSNNGPISPGKLSVKSCQVPIPAPRHKNKESPKSQQIEPIKDLISLDDGNSSFELEDFDPLNKNAKPMPALSKSQSTSTKKPTLPASTSSCSSLAINSAPSATLNPIYPYFTPQHRSHTPQQPSSSDAANDDELELLRKYGLDQFTLTNGKEPQPPPKNMSQWTTFD